MTVDTDVSLLRHRPTLRLMRDSVTGEHTLYQMNIPRDQEDAEDG